VSPIVCVQFVRAFAAYNAGEVAGFHAERADELVQKGVAIRLEPQAVAPVIERDVPVETASVSAPEMAVTRRGRPRRG